MICNHTCAHELSGVWEFEVMRRNIAKYLGVVIASFFLSFFLSFFFSFFLFFFLSVFLCDGESFGFIFYPYMRSRTVRCVEIRSGSARYGNKSRRHDVERFGFNCTYICDS